MRAPVASIVTGQPRPSWRGRVHTWAFGFSLPASVGLFLVAEPVGARIGAAIFGVSLVALYGVSACYHRIARSEEAQRLMRRLDHCMIFVLIAGTYTPLCLVALPPRWSVPLLSLAWGLAAVGIAVKLWGSGRLLRASGWLYIANGWVAVVALPVMLRSVSPAVIALMVLGGLLYTVGAAVLATHWPDPRPAVFGYHEVWHTFTVLAGVSHFAMVTLVVS